MRADRTPVSGLWLALRSGGRLFTLTCLLAATFDLVLHPKLDTQSIVSCDRSSPMDSMNKQLALAWAPARYGMRLQKTCAESGARRWDVGEGYSTVLCFHCARRAPVGRARVFRCANPECSGGSHYTSGRDVDGALCTEAMNIGRMARQIDLGLLATGQRADGSPPKRPRLLSEAGHNTTVMTRF